MIKTYFKLIYITVVLCGGVRANFAQSVDTVFYTNNSPLTFNQVNAVTTDADQNVWVGTEYGLNRINKNGWQSWFAETSNLHDNAIRSLKVDENNTLWIGGFKEDSVNLTYIDKNNVHLFKKPKALSRFIRDFLFIEKDTTKMMLLATESGLGIYTLNTQQWQIYNLNTSPYLTSPNFTSLAYSIENGIYAGTLNGGLVNLKNNGNIRVIEGDKSGLPDNTILDVAIDTAGLIWLATPEGGLISYNNQTFESITPDNSALPSRSISSIVISPQNDIWCGTLDAGVVLIKKTGITTFNTKNSMLLSDRIYEIHQQNDSTIWAATNKGLARIKTGNQLPVPATVQTIKVTNMVYPNPTNGNFRVAQQHYINQLTVYNTKGAVVYMALKLAPYINLQHLPKGSYFLNITANNTVYVQKIVII